MMRGYSADKHFEMARMATLPQRTPNSQPVLAEFAGALRYVARQPILDLRGRVHGYELLFRAGPELAFRGDGDSATRTMLDNTVVYGLERLTGGLPAFVNCTTETLTESLAHVLPPSMVVLEILESIEPTPELIKICHNLKASGFRLALDDFTWRPKFDPLVEMADYIKVDFMISDARARQRLLRRLRNVSVALIAEKIETQEEYKRACLEGFTLFQGYYFCRPVLLENRNIPANRLSHIEILQLLRSDSIDLQKLTELLKHDASLTYRLLRLVNSPMCAIRQEVRSIQAALIAVGEDTFRHIAMLAIATELNAGQPAEVLRMAFVRGRFCELAAGLCSMDSTEQYLLGMMSMLPAMLRIPMQELTASLPLRNEIREALKGAGNPERALLAWVEAHERGDWAVCDTAAAGIGLDRELLAACYSEALVWAEAALSSAV
ncbi:MAG: HDOD domain-containing protein [Terracidiphilus sp.]|jgi:EAL and modified HD-GYP domain-containing signal transduction protein